MKSLRSTLIQVSFLDNLHNFLFFLPIALYFARYFHSFFVGIFGNVLLVSFNQEKNNTFSAVEGVVSN